MDSRRRERKAEGGRGKCRLQTGGLPAAPAHSSPPFRPPPSAVHVIGLPADHVARPGGLGQRRTTRRGHRRRLDLLGQHLEGQRQQGVAGQNGRGLVERLVAGGPAAPQIVVVHGRQIVVDQRIGVDHFDRAGGRHGRFDRPAARLGGQQHQHRPQPFARRQEAVAHRLAEPRRAAVAQVESGRPRPRRSAGRATGRVRQTREDGH